MSISALKLPLTQEERVRLRSYKVKLKDIAYMGTSELSDMLASTLEKAQYLRALVVFQRIPSIGPRAAQWAIDLGYYSLDEIKYETGPNLVNRLEELYGCWVDPCVEDALWCIVHHANHPGSNKSWFEFTEERKRFRLQNGYPATRPARAWYE